MVTYTCQTTPMHVARSRKEARAPSKRHESRVPLAAAFANLLKSNQLRSPEKAGDFEFEGRCSSRPMGGQIELPVGVAAIAHNEPHYLSHVRVCVVVEQNDSVFSQ